MTKAERLKLIAKRARLLERRRDAADRASWIDDEDAQADEGIALVERTTKR